MKKDNFLDTNIIFNYSNYNDSSGNIVKKCYLFVVNKSGKFILCWAVLRELSEIIKKRARIHKEVLRKLQNSNYSFEESPLISKRDIPFIKQIYERFKYGNSEEVSNSLKLDRRLSEIKIEQFLKTKVDEKVIPINQINGDLVGKIHDIIPNHADCKILASALQLQQIKEKIFNFVTADGQDLDPNGYEYLKEHFEINCPKEKYIFPNLVNLMF
ncbi:MAG TPA: hypothetical protein ENG87_03280 [Candidatus Pacearchaeota archaeon]|nr:hypothetical protein BMS3Abin17_01054 [archaeon BMS3Abin17]HDK42376.1 hypothetical protein [Candidatus Pacearchaeota archaeon]HDZ60738.1 hypothetical protein [Candidatus Pacearchaeota archaeon]